MTVSNGACIYVRVKRAHAVDAARCAEPGYYADGRYGIRIENVVIVRTADTPNNFGDKGFLGFEHVTLVRPLPCLLSSPLSLSPPSSSSSSPLSLCDGSLMYVRAPVPHGQEPHRRRAAEREGEGVAGRVPRGGARQGRPARRGRRARRGVAAARVRAAVACRCRAVACGRVCV